MPQYICCVITDLLPLRTSSHRRSIVDSPSAHTSLSSTDEHVTVPIRDVDFGLLLIVVINPGSGTAQETEMSRLDVQGTAASRRT
jgi:hypothetical protein